MGRAPQRPDCGAGQSPEVRGELVQGCFSAQGLVSGLVSSGVRRPPANLSNLLHFHSFVLTSLSLSGPSPAPLLALRVFLSDCLLREQCSQTPLAASLKQSPLHNVCMSGNSARHQHGELNLYNRTLHLHSSKHIPAFLDACIIRFPPIEYATYI